MNADPLQTALQFAAALGLGVLLGLERERQKARKASFAGVRTFGLIALSGARRGLPRAALQQPWLALARLRGDRGARGRVLRGERAARRARQSPPRSRRCSPSCSATCACAATSRSRPGLAVASGGVLALKEWLHRLAGRIETRRRRGDAQVRDRQHHHPAARAEPELRAGAARRDQPLQDLAHGGADLGAQLRELPAGEGASAPSTASASPACSAGSSRARR